MATERVRQPREPWPFILASALIFMIGTSLTFYAIARSHPDALVVADAYEAGLQYNQIQAEQRAAEALGLDIRLEATLSPGNAQLRVDVIGRDGNPVEAGHVSVRRERPAEGGYDADFPLAATSRGFVGEVPLPLSGRWHLVVTADVEGQTVRRSFGIRG